ncbi:hypothetical protein ACA910_016530 [Epithemia clementina (nom. ined.)]
MSSLKEKVPSKFYCPLTLTIMEDPLMTREGHSYEKSAILTWLSTHDTSPLTREPLEVSQLLSNHALRSEIHAWRERKIYVNMQGTDSDTEFISDLDDDDDDDDDDDYYVGDGNKKADDISDAALFVFKLSPDEMKEYNWSRALLLSSMPGRDESQEQHQQQQVEDEEVDDGAGEELIPRSRRTRSNNINNANSINSNSNNSASSEESSQRRTMSRAMRSALLFGRRRRRASVSRDS